MIRGYKNDRPWGYFYNFHHQCDVAISSVLVTLEVCECREKVGSVPGSFSTEIIELKQEIPQLLSYLQVIYICISWLPSSGLHWLLFNLYFCALPPTSDYGTGIWLFSFYFIWLLSLSLWACSNLYQETQTFQSTPLYLLLIPHISISIKGSTLIYSLTTDNKHHGLTGFWIQETLSVFFFFLFSPWQLNLLNTSLLW